MKSSRGSRRLRSDAIQRELRSLRDEAQAAGGSSSIRTEGSTVERRHQQRQSRRENLEGRRASEDESQTIRHERRRRASTEYVSGAGAATDDSYGEEDERAPFGGTPMMSTSARLALAERELAEVIAQRDEALDELDAYRRENAKLREELERARSYKALYAAAHEEHKGMKASLAASTQICMGQQKLIQMLQASPGSSALDAEELFVGPLGVRTPPPFSPSQRRRASTAFDRRAEEKAEALAAAAIALAKGRRGGEGRDRRDREGLEEKVSSGGEGGGRGSGGVDSDAAAAAEAVVTAPEAESLRKSRSWSPALIPEHRDTASVSARRAFAMRAAAMASEAAVREGLGAADLEGDGGASGRRSGSSARESSRGPGLRRMGSLDDDLISHSSLRREYDETFLNQPLRGEHYQWERGFEGDVGDFGEDMGGVAADQGRARARGHGRERTRTKSGSQSSVSTAASASKSSKGLGKDEQTSRRSKSERSSARDNTTAGATSSRGARGSSPRASAPRQARVSQRLSSGTSSSFASSAAAASSGAGGGSSSAAGDPREPSSSRRSSTGSSVRSSTRKR